MKLGLLDFGRIVVERRGHELDDPGQNLKPADHVGGRRQSAPIELVDLSDPFRAHTLLAGRHVVTDKLASLPNHLGRLELWRGQLVPGHEARHRQGEL